MWQRVARGNVQQHSPDTTAFALRAHAGNVTIICKYVCRSIYVCMYVVSFPGLPCFRSLVCVQYNTWKRKSVINTGGLGTPIT